MANGAILRDNLANFSRQFSDLGPPSQMGPNLATGADSGPQVFQFSTFARVLRGFPALDPQAQDPSSAGPSKFRVFFSLSQLSFVYFINHAQLGSLDIL